MAVTFHRVSGLVLCVVLVRSGLLSDCGCVVSDLVFYLIVVVLVRSGLLSDCGCVGQIRSSI